MPKSELEKKKKRLQKEIEEYTSKGKAAPDHLVKEYERTIRQLQKDRMEAIFEKYGDKEEAAAPPKKKEKSKSKSNVATKTTPSHPQFYAVYYDPPKEKKKKKKCADNKVKVRSYCRRKPTK